MRRRRGFKRRRRFGRRGRGTRAIAKRGLRVAKRVQRLIEVKENGIQQLSTDATTTPSLAFLNGIAQGTTAVTRVGEQISLRNMTIHFETYPKSNTFYTNPAVFVRVILFWDTQANGTTPAASDVLELSAIPVIAADNYTVPKWVNRRRFRIIKDKVMTFHGFPVWNGGSILDPVAAYKHWKWFIKFKRKQVTYNGAGNGIANIQKNALWLMYYSNQAVNLWVLTTNYRYTFWDA